MVFGMVGVFVLYSVFGWLGMVVVLVLVCLVLFVWLFFGGMIE